MAIQSTKHTTFKLSVHATIDECLAALASLKEESIQARSIHLAQLEKKAGYARVELRVENSMFIPLILELLEDDLFYTTTVREVFVAEQPMKVNSALVLFISVFLGIPLVLYGISAFADNTEGAWAVFVIFIIFASVIVHHLTTGGSTRDIRSENILRAVEKRLKQKFKVS